MQFAEESRGSLPAGEVSTRDKGSQGVPNTGPKALNKMLEPVARIIASPLKVKFGQ